MEKYDERKKAESEAGMNELMRVKLNRFLPLSLKKLPSGKLDLAILV
jgi:hypothetical protein